MPPTPATLLPLLPEALRTPLAAREWTPATEGQSGGTVYRIAADGQRTLYLKAGRDHVADDIAAEAARLQWLAGRLPVPEVIHFNGPDDGHVGLDAKRTALLLMTAIPGEPAYDVLVAQPEQRLATVAALARFLARIHALPIDDCPFNAEAPLRLADARHRIDQGLVDTDDFDDEHAGWTAEQVWDEITALLPLPFKRVFTHGDYSLHNVLMADGEVTGCIDLGRAGIADPNQDRAILWQNLREFGDGVGDATRVACGVAKLDASTLRFHLGLDEFF